MLEYPKFLPWVNDDGSENDERGLTVHTAFEEADAVARGYAARPSAAKGQQTVDVRPVMHLEFPKVVYKGDGDAQESRVVKDAAQEADAAFEGFAPLGAPVVDDAEPESAEFDDDKPKRGRKKK